jgi:hypothetical protein
MTDAAVANDVVYSVLVDPASTAFEARHAVIGPALLADPPPTEPEAAVPAEPEQMTVEQKRAVLAAGIRARGEDPIARAARP